jgi:hypothetical protein
MAKILRKIAKIFGSTASSDQIGEFGSLANGAPAYTSDPTVIQSLSNYAAGWFAAVIGGNSPAIEDVNALDYLWSYQLAYLMQAGMPEYDATTTYYTNSMVNYLGAIYVCQFDNITGVSPAASGTDWHLIAPLSGGGGAGGTGKNYITTYNGNPGNGDFETNTTAGFTLFHTTLTGTLPTGAITAGASSFNSFAVTTTNPLGAKHSLAVGSTAGFVAGQGIISDVFTIDNEDRAKVLGFGLFYQILTGSAFMDFSGSATNTFAVYIYDVTNSAWIQPSGVYNFVQKSGAGEAFGTYQSNSNTNQYRIAVLCINSAATGASTLLFDDFSVGPAPIANGAAISDWQSFTPTGAFVTNSTYNGQFRRVGGNLEVEFGIAFTGAPGTTPAALINLPPGLSVDLTKIPNGGGFIGLGRTVSTDTGGNEYSGSLVYHSPTDVLLLSAFVGSVTIQDGGLTDLVPFAFVNNTFITGSFSVPIAGWSSNSVMSADTDTRVVAASLAMVGSFAASPGNGILWDTVVYDTHAAYNASNSLYTAPISGYYRILLSEADDTTINNGLILINGAIVAQGQQHTNATEPGLTAITVKLNAGDTIHAELSNSGTMMSGPTINFMTIEMLNGPAVIAASEDVFACYGQGSPQSIPASVDTQLTNWALKLCDSHNAFEPVGGVYTVPVSGSYLIKMSSQFSDADGTGTYVSKIFNTRSGTPTNLVYGQASQGQSQTTIECSTIYPLLAGDQVTSCVVQTTGSTKTINADPTSVQFYIQKVGHFNG